MGDKIISAPLKDTRHEPEADQLALNAGLLLANLGRGSVAEAATSVVLTAQAKQAVDAVKGLAADDPKLAVEQIKTLGKAAIPALLDGLDSKDSRIARRSSEMLKALGAGEEVARRQDIRDICDNFKLGMLDNNRLGSLISSEHARSGMPGLLKLQDQLNTRVWNDAVIKIDRGREKGTVEFAVVWHPKKDVIGPPTDFVTVKVKDLLPKADTSDTTAESKDRRTEYQKAVEYNDQFQKAVDELMRRPPLKIPEGQRDRDSAHDKEVPKKNFNPRYDP